MANKVLTQPELAQALNSLPGWSVEKGRLVASVECADFPAAMALVIRVALLAEKADHHPDEMNVMWRTVRFALVTHSAKGITAKDVEFARSIQALAG